jgi:hypothetical protein
MRALNDLVSYKSVFGADAARSVARLLERLDRTRITQPADLIVLHETVLYLRAYPQSPRVLHLAEKLLRSFPERLRGMDPDEFTDPEVSGVAGTSVSSNFSYEFARSLADRHSDATGIDWENFERPDRLGLVLARLLPAAAEIWSVEAHVDWRDWFVTRGLTLRWLLDRVDQPTYDLLEIPIRLDVGPTASRSLARIPRRRIFYHGRPLLRRRDVSLEDEFGAPPIPVRRVKAAQARGMAAVMVDASVVRYRELWGFVHPDVNRMYHADLGRGVDFYFCGVPPQWRLPLRAYHAGMFFKNGVPMGYFEGLSLFERMEAGFNLYYTFREGETAWLYARLLKLFREQLGVTCFSVDPYQIGRDNEEAIASGAFWFYRKLGFRPAFREAARLTAREEKKIAANPDYRTPPDLLRQLAVSPMVYGGVEEWGRFSMHQLGPRIPPWPRRLLQAKNAAAESLYLRMLQSSPNLRRTLLRRRPGRLPDGRGALSTVR